MKKATPLILALRHALGGVATALLPLLIKPSKKHEEAVYHLNKQ